MDIPLFCETCKAKLCRNEHVVSDCPDCLKLYDPLHPKKKKQETAEVSDQEKEVIHQ